MLVHTGKTGEKTIKNIDNYNYKQLQTIKNANNTQLTAQSLFDINLSTNDCQRHTVGSCQHVCNRVEVKSAGNRQRRNHLR